MELTGRPSLGGLGFSAQPDLSTRHFTSQLLMFVDIESQEEMSMDDTDLPLWR